MMKKDDFGALYIASGKKCFREAIDSMMSLRNLCPNVPCAIITNPENKDHEIFQNSWCKLIVQKGMTFTAFDKPFFMHKTPFKKTLILDTDTRVLANIEPMKDILDVFDMALTLDTSRGKIYYPPPTYDNPPKPYRFLHQYNDGVMLFKLNNRVKKFIKIRAQLCKKEYQVRKAGGKNALRAMTQPSLVIALGKSLVKLITLPFAFNYRLTWGAPDAVGPVRIVHGRNYLNNKQVEQINIGFSKAEIDKPYKFIPDPKKLRIFLTSVNYCLRPYQKRSLLILSLRILEHQLLDLLYPYYKIGWWKWYFKHKWKGLVTIFSIVVSSLWIYLNHDILPLLSELF